MLLLVTGFVSASYSIELAIKPPVVQNFRNKHVFPPNEVPRQLHTTLQNFEALLCQVFLSCLANMINCHRDLLGQLGLALAYKQACQHFSLQLPLSELICSLFCYLAQSRSIDPEQLHGPQ